MSDERLSDEKVAMFTDDRWYDPHTQRNKLTATALLAREVQGRRKNDWANDLAHLKLSVDMLAVRDLCARHDITVEGIVALVDEVMDHTKFHNVTHGSFLLGLRRLARGEDA